MKKILILGVSAVQYDAIKTLNELGYETYAIAMKKDGPGAEIAKHFEEINILDYSSVKKYIEENNISVVYSTGSDLAIPVAMKLSEELGLPHFVSEETARICNNKDLMRQTLGENFEGNIPFQIFRQIDEKIKLEFPFILKPTDSQGQRGVAIVNSFSEFKNHFEIAKKYSRSGLVIGEKYIQGPEISVNGYVIDGDVKFLKASDRITWEKYVGLIHKHVIPSKALDNISTKKLQSIMNNLVKKLNILNGPIYAQVKVEENQPYIIEVTPRLDGCHMWKVLEKSNGINLMRLTFQHLVERDYSEIENINNETKAVTLEFICQEPNTGANYDNYDYQIQLADESYMYYQQGETIRPVNGKYEKIGYMIYI